MAKDWDEDDWSPEARARFEKSQNRRQGISGAAVDLRKHNKRRKARAIARAVFESRQDGKYQLKAAVARLQEQQPNANWDYQTARKFYKSRECQIELWRLEARADSNSLHEREELIRIITDSLHFDKTTIYIEGTYDLKPFDEWSPIAKFAFDGMDWKTPKGLPPIPVPKFLSKEGLIEKAGKELGMWKERNVLENPDGSPLTIQIVKFAKPEDQGEK